MSVFGIILVRIFPVFSRIRTEYGEIRSTNTFYAASRSTKIDYSPRNSLKIKQLTAFGKTEFDNATYGLYISLTTIFKNDNLKYTAMSQKRSFNYFLLFYIFFFSHCFLLNYLFSNPHAQRDITSIIYIAYHIF